MSAHDMRVDFEDRTPTAKRRSPMPSESFTVDPVCGMSVSVLAPNRAEHGGRQYVFCSSGCREKFLADPSRYTSGGKASDGSGVEPTHAQGKRSARHEDGTGHQTSPAGAMPAPVTVTLYTCPMHPQIRRSEPGACPICGMTLEPIQPGTAESAPSPELRDMTRRFWVGAALSVPLLLIEMGPDLGKFTPLRTLSPLASVWFQLVCGTPVVLWAGWPLLKRGWASLQNRSLNMFTLITLGVSAAYLYSLLATFAAGIFPDSLRGPGGVVPVYYEAAAVITVLVLLGQMLELRARETTGSAIRALLNLAPKQARRIRGDGSDEEIPLDQIQLGDHLRVRPGEAVPVDGVVLDGASALDESMVTGESMPVAKERGAQLIGATINRTGALVMRAEHVGADTMLSRIIQMVSEAQRSRAPIQRLADQVSAWFVPAVIAIAMVTFAVWMWTGPQPRLAYALVAAVAVLIIACPCALGLATPMSIMVAVEKGAMGGVLIKNAEVLERLEKIDTLVIDKTGTLTEGKPRVVGIEVVAGFDEMLVLSLAASLERASEHPLAAAIAVFTQERSLAPEEVKDFRSIPGKGVVGQVGNHRVCVGNVALLAQEFIPLADLESRAAAVRGEGATAMFVGVDGRPAGVIAVADPIKVSTPTALQNLRHDGIHIIMVTGDHRATAEAVARRLGLSDIQAEVLPESKNAIVRELQRQGHAVAMAGDGVNDAPALAEAEVGIAMGTGTDVAMQSAGVTLVKGDLAGIARARALSRATMRNIRQNLLLAFVYNTLGIPIAAGVLYPAFGMLLSPIIAAAAMSLSSVSVIGNALRLRLLRL
jgi:Cu+-exporting ATPase